MKYRRITYAKHAHKKKAKRKVSRKQIERTLQKPERVFPSYGKLVAESTTEHGNIIWVVFVEPAEGEAKVITVYRKKRKD